MSNSGHDLSVPIWQKYTLTIEEAAAYFRIGEHKLRKVRTVDKDELIKALEKHEKKVERYLKR